jgi:hypothetical protein
MLFYVVYHGANYSSDGNSSPPISPGSHPTVNPLVTPPPDLKIVRSRKKIEKKREERVNPENLEEKWNWFSNIFFCFFFPVVCRRGNLETWHIPVVHSKDEAVRAVVKGERAWLPKYKKYLIAKAEYDRLKQMDETYDIKEPEKPSYISVLVFNVADWELFWSLFIMMLSYVIFFAFIFCSKDWVADCSTDNNERID